jgi:hypothetical protein
MITYRAGLKFYGFASMKELVSLAWECRYDMPRFVEWQKTDRTKDGLLALGKRPEYSQAAEFKEGKE